MYLWAMKEKIHLKYLIVVHGLLVAVASLVAEHRL